ncbi:hypothetical protein L6164_036021 [Bauhinia variegata]|uniref:Uncharacterized protein n=1 Tax=Bauhinia variegata TaxID=167791 RepID=A0ACB9KFT7_BAUVA|nr:hypothetical protein L6164_036021 [Bauhinia variegata]
MSETIPPVFVEWEEQIVCHERGSRVIHFYLKCANGDSVLAVIGTERSVRHMMYVISDQLLEVCGSTESVAAYKWRARREVVEWLSCLVSRSGEKYIDDSNVQIHDSTQAVESLEILAQAAGVSANKKNSPDKSVSRKLKFHSSDIEWSGIAWICAKQLKHYPGFCRNGTAISVHSFVYIMAEEENHYLGYVEDMYEDKKGQKKVKVRWFHHSQEVKRMIPQVNVQPGEVFITPHVQVISAECVNGPATVLTSKHYERCLASIAHISLSEVHMCCRQLKNNKIKPFTLTKLRGYSSQSVLSCLNSPIVSKRKVKQDEDDPGLTRDDTLKLSSKRNRNSKGHQVLEKDFSGPQNINPRNQMTKSGPTYPRLKLRFARKPIGIKVIGPKPQCHLSFKIDEKIELLCQDSGIRGCWFRCKVLNTSRKKLKVQYDDLLDVDGLRKLEECVPASRVAAPDKLGTRCSGRLTVRPCPPDDDTTDRTFEVGAPVDAWWSDGWWEGVVTSVNDSGDGTLQIYLPGEEKFVTLEKKNIRVSRDWVGNRWVDIPRKPDICSYLSSDVGSRRKLPTDSALVGVSVSDGSVILGSRLPSIQVKVEPEYGLDASDDLERMKRLTLSKLLHAIDEDKGDDSGDGSDGGTDEDSKEKLIGEENFDNAQLKLDAAEAVAVALHE